MTTIDVEFSEQDISDVKSMLSGIKDGAATAIMRAINQGLSTGKTQGAKEVGQIYTLKSSRIKKDFDMRKATKAELSGSVWATGEPVGLLNFSANKVNAGYSVKVLKSGGRSVLKHAFKAKTRKARKDGTTYETEHLWWRSYDGPRSGSGTTFVGYFGGLPSGHKFRDPIERLEGPRIEDALSRPEVLAKVQDAASEKMQSKLATETYNLLRRYG